MSIVLVFIIVFATGYFLSKWHKIFLIGIKIPGPWAIPMMGNIQMITKLSPEKLLYQVQNFREACGESFRLWLGPQLWVFLHTPEEHRDALQDNTLRKAETFLFLDKLIGNGLLISHGKQWETHRKALGSAFHPNILNDFTEPICQHGDIMISLLRNSKYEAVEINEYLFPCIMDIIFDTSMGKNLQIQRDKNNQYIHAFHRTTELLFQRMTNPLLFSDFIYSKLPASKELDKCLQIIHELMESVIQERQEYLNEIKDIEETCSTQERKSPKCLLDTLLRMDIEQNCLSLKEIRDEVNTFVLAGVDTTTAAMAFVLYALGKYPQEQEKLIQELRANDLENNDHIFSPNELNKLEYLEMFLKECLRFYTTVPLTGRQTTQSTRIGHRTYPAGITLWINMYGLAHDKSLFEDPMVFRPSRFAKELYANLPSYSYIPFSAGPHICIGRKYALLIMKLLTLKILQNYKVELNNPDEELLLMTQMVLKAKNGINLKFKERL